MKSFFLMVLSLILCCSCNNVKEEVSTNKEITANDNIRPEIEKTVSAIAKKNIVTGPYIGEAAEISVQWERYHQLLKNASADELHTLTNNKNGAVRYYAFKALVTRDSTKILPLVLQHLHDTAQVVFRAGCLGGREMVGDKLLSMVYNKNLSDNYHLTNNQQKLVDSILINDKTILLSERRRAINDLIPSDHNYNKIREIVETEQNELALLILSKYRRQQDKQLIASFFEKGESHYYALMAVEEFPDVYFYPFVKELFIEEWNKDQKDWKNLDYCYQILAMFPNPSIYKLFETTLISYDEFRREALGEYLLTAITKHSNKIWEPLKERIRLNEKYMEQRREIYGN
ncbi:hypothetical protein ACW9KT_08935 [Hymenobacter sp. HD11105]